MPTAKTTQPASAQDAPAEKRESRVHVIGGVPCRVLRTEFDVRQNVVFDYVERVKVVRTRDGSFKDVVVERRVVAPPEIQAKYAAGPQGTIVVEE